MTILYAVVLLAGVISLVAWVAATAVADSVDGWDRVHPERRFGRPGRLVVAGLTGAGMAGMSAEYAGWPAWLTLIAAVAGGAGIAVIADVFGAAD